MKLKPALVTETLNFGINATTWTVRFVGRGALGGLNKLMPNPVDRLLAQHHEQRPSIERAQQQIAQGAGEFTKAVCTDQDTSGPETLSLPRAERIMGVGFALRKFGIPPTQEALSDLGTDPHAAEIIEKVVGNSEPKLLE